MNKGMDIGLDEDLLEKEPLMRHRKKRMIKK